MKINKLIDCSYDVDVTGITDDSRNVRNGYLFVATHGFNIDHYDYIDMAIKNGCSFVICDREINYNIPHIVVENINSLYYELCRKFYNLDLDSFNLIGITGTDGKTTTATIIHDIIPQCAYIGTNGVELSNKSISTNNTTPCISELYKDLSYIRDNGYSNVSMEVSSEALLHYRVRDLRYSIICFTNITGDHLNIHKSFDNYVKCKMKLLDLVRDGGSVVINGDDEILNGIKHNNLYKIGFNKNNDFVITNVIYNKHNSLITINDSIHINSPLIGKYNVYNVVMAYVVGLLYGVDSDVLINKISNISPISGRGEFLDFGQNYDIVLDYAHTINGIKSILDTFKNYPKVIVVTGCAGGRDKSKRSIIGSMIMDRADVSIFTMDDPRYEDVNDIIDDMVQNRTDYIRITDRVKAINYALDIADKGSVVLILGKGRDNYMAMSNGKIEYSDYDTIYNYFNKKKTA